MNSSIAASCGVLQKILNALLRPEVPRALGITSLCIIAVILTPAALLASDSISSALIASDIPPILNRPVDLPRSLFPFRTYGADSGLGNLAIRRIVQDSVGYLWVGTEDGLYRYNGDRFTRYDFDSGLRSTWITDLLATPDANLFVCTPQGLSTQSGDKFEAIKEESGLPSGACNAVARDSRGVIWVAHKNGLFFKSDAGFRRLGTFPAGPANAIVSLPGPSSSIFAAAKGIVYRVDNYRIVGSLPVMPGSAEPIDSLAADGSRRIWAQSARKLFSLPPGAARFQDESAELPTISSGGVLSTDRGGRLWVPTDEGMSCRIGNEWRHFSPKDGLPTEWTQYIFEDREGSLWVGSLGVHRLVGRGSWTSWTRDQGLPSDTIWDIYRSRRGDLWVATDKGLCLATSQGWRVITGTEKSVVRQIHEDSKGRLWLGLVPAAILRYDPDTNRISKFGSSQGVSGVRVLCLEEDGEGQLWAATDKAGLLHYRPDQNDFIREEVPQGAPDETFRFILLDKHNRLWATGENGLLLRSNGKWRRFGKQDGLLRNHVSYITEIHTGELWLSYFEALGIIRFRIKDDKLEILEQRNKHNGLSSEKVYMLGEDLNGDLWVGTGRGIDVFSNKDVRHFSKSSGVAGDDINAMAFLVEANGSRFIGTSGGLSMYRNSADIDQVQLPKPVFLGADLTDHPLKLADDVAQTFSHQFNTLNVRFAVLSFTHESQIEYAIRLKGLETEWHTSQIHESRYAGLAPGSYVYEVRSRFGSGDWSDTASIAFEIQPPWWRTFPAIAAWLMLIASAVFTGFRWRLQHLSKRTHQLQNLVSARTIELAIANADLERLSITDPLTGMKNRRFVEFSIAEDLARVRRSFQYVQGEWHSPTDEGSSIGFLLIDIDHFKEVNDRFGHAAGDRVLRQMSGVFSSVVRESDTTARWGGEEFLVIARSSRGNDSAVLADRIRKQVESTAFTVNDQETVRLTCSVGFSVWPFFKHDPDALGWQDVLALVDRSLYLAKNCGRNAWMGVTARPDYRGHIESGMLNDFRSAESKGIIRIQSSASAGTAEQQYSYTSRQTTETRTFQ
jgi:diguanylate cyclase (GGDEF)-like protein